MAVQTRREFVYRNIELYKEDTLGTGSYGGVCKAKCDGLPCAAKIMHPTLFDLRDPGTVSYLRKFEEECCLLSLARHPNVVQYLATYRDPDTRLPVLLMELCDESLCRFLERSPGPLPYHTQLNISHDITLALVYLHSNGLTHRDLTGNNVLMIAGVRAKVTDFGMSKLASVNPRMTPMTLCPGNVQYMSPEVLEEPPFYTDKLDVFSFGVLLVQIMTRHFPNPGPRFQAISVPNYTEGTVRVAVPETQRRSAHLKLIAYTHPLKAIAISCLKGKERERPSTQQLSNTLSELKRAPHYTESLQQAQTGVGGGREVDSLRGQVRDLQQQNHTLEQEIEQQRGKNKQLQTVHDRVVAQNQRLEQQLQGQRVLTEAKMRDVQQLQSNVKEKERELVQNRHAIEASEQLVAQFQQSLQQKDKTISDLWQTTSAHERKIQQLEQQDKHVGSQLSQPLAAAKVSQAAVVPAVQRNITQLRWEEGKRAPERMLRGAAVIEGNTVYISPYGSQEVYSCHVISWDQQWSTLASHPYSDFSLVLINGLLTSVGGHGSSGYINSLFSLTREGAKRQWSVVFPAMPTPRSGTASVTTEQALIVAGGLSGRRLDTVEVMDIPSRQWSTASRLPHPFYRMSALLCGDHLYLAGGYDESGEASTSVLTCSLTDLLPSQSLEAKLHRVRRTLLLASKTGVWRKARNLPIFHATLITLGGHLLAIGGEDNIRKYTAATLTTLGGHLLAIGGMDDSGERTAAVHCYDARTDFWHVVSQMKGARSRCLAAALPEDRLLVVGGLTTVGATDSLEIGRIP